MITTSTRMGARTRKQLLSNERGEEYHRRLRRSLKINLPII